LTNVGPGVKIYGQQTALGRKEIQMAGTVLNAILLGLLILAAILCIFAPLTALGVMFWHWHRELKETMRLRQARSTQVR